MTKLFESCVVCFPTFTTLMTTFSCHYLSYTIAKNSFLITLCLGKLRPTTVPTTMKMRWREYARLVTSDTTKLPLSSKSSEKNNLALRLQVPKRYSRLLPGLATALGFAILFTTSVLLLRRYTGPHSYPHVRRTPLNKEGLPPLFEAYSRYECHLPQQQNDDFAARKYIFMANHAHGCGWGNVLQEMIYSSLVASESGRG